MNEEIFTLDLYYNKGIVDERWFSNKTGFKVFFLTFFKYYLGAKSHHFTLKKNIYWINVKIISVRILKKKILWMWNYFNKFIKSKRCSF